MDNGKGGYYLVGYDKQQFGGSITTTELANMCKEKLKTAAQSIDEIVFVEDIESSGTVIGGKFTLLDTYTLTVQMTSTSQMKVTIKKGNDVIGEYAYSLGSNTKYMGYILAANPYAAAFYLFNNSEVNVAAFILTTDGVSWYNSTSSASDVAIPGSVLWTDESTMTKIYSSVVRLPYTVGGTDVEIIEGIALTSGGQKVKTAQGLCNSSNVTAKTRFNLDGEAFFALNGNIIIKL